MGPSNGAVRGNARRIMITMTQSSDFPSATDALISLRGVTKSYLTHSGTFTALHDVSLDIRRGEFVGDRSANRGAGSRRCSI